MARVYVLGTAHNLPVKDTLQAKIVEEKIQAIIKEGVGTKDAYNLRNFALEPFLMVFTWVWFHDSASVQDTKSLWKMKENSKIAFHNDVDTDISTMIRFIHHWSNYVLGFLLYAFWFVFLNLLVPVGGWVYALPITVPIALILSGACLFQVMVWIKLQKFRDEIMISNTLKRIKEHHYERVLFSCGLTHKKNTISLLKSAGCETVELRDYQDAPLWDALYAKVAGQDL